MLSKVFFFKYPSCDYLKPLWCTGLTIDLEAGVISGWVENGHWNMTYYTDKKRIHHAPMATGKGNDAELIWVGNAYDGTDYMDVIYQAEQRMLDGEPSEL